MICRGDVFVHSVFHIMSMYFLVIDFIYISQNMKKEKASNMSALDKLL